MRYFLLALVFLSGNGCFSMSKTDNSYNQVMNVINKYSKNLKKEGITNRWYGLHYAGPDKIYDGKIHEISLGYSMDKNLKYHDARKLFYRVVDELLNEINKNEVVQEYFYHYPVTYEDLHFSLAFDYEDKGYLRRDDVELISIQFNKIFYSIANVDGATDKLIFNETCPGMGTITHTGLDSTRKIIRKLPESEKEANTAP